MQVICIAVMELFSQEVTLYQLNANSQRKELVHPLFYAYERLFMFYLEVVTTSMK